MNIGGDFGINEIYMNQHLLFFILFNWSLGLLIKGHRNDDLGTFFSRIAVLLIYSTVFACISLFALLICHLVLCLIGITFINDVILTMPNKGPDDGDLLGEFFRNFVYIENIGLISLLIYNIFSKDEFNTFYPK
jgi:hypothetical protein